MSDTSTDQGRAPHSDLARRARIAGQITVGLVVGCLLVPSLFELLSLIGGISPFKYQGF